MYCCMSRLRQESKFYDRLFSKFEDRMDYMYFWSISKIGRSRVNHEYIAGGLT